MANPFDKFDAPSENPFDKFDGPEAAPAPAPSQGRELFKKLDNLVGTGALVSKLDTLAGVGKGLHNTALGLQHYVGKGARAVGLERAGKWLEDDARTGRQKADAELAPHKKRSPIAAGAGELGGEIIATLPVGGALARGVKAIGGAPALVNSIRSGGFRTGAPAATTLEGKALDLGTRAAGGALTGGVSAAVVNPGQGDAGALIGGGLPLALTGLGKATNYAGRVGHSLVAPYTDKGRQKIAGKILNKFADGGPTAVNADEIVPGSLPTLAEATGNAGLAGLQRTARDLDPNRFVPREQANAAARSAAFDGIAGDKAAIELAISARDDAAKPLYGRAFTADAMRQDLAKSAQQARAPFAGVGLSGAREDLATPGLRELASRPQFRDAVNDARKLAANNGVRLDDPLQSLEGLHYIKLALDDALNPQAKSAMGRNASNAVMDMRDKLADELAGISPLYGAARNTFADMSKPINAMESLQGLRLTDAQGNITLAKVKNAIEGLERKRAAPGVDAAKSITDEQLKTLRAIHDDLLRQANTGLGRSAGSNTYQNIATDNILGTMLPGKLGGAVTGRLGSVVGQVGRLAYSGPNEQIKNGLLEMMLDPKQAEQAMQLARQLPGPSRVGGLLDSTFPWASRAGLLLGSDQ